MSNLREIQQRMGNAVMHPLTDNDTTPRRLKSEAEAIIKPNDRLSSLERLEIYSRSYWFRVLDSLVEDFPGVRAIVGTREFHELSRDYLTEHPSTSFTLRNLGSRFLDWLTRNSDRVKPHESLTLDMARLEWAHIEAFDGADKPTVAAESWARSGGDATFHLQPYVRLVEANFPVDDILLEIRELDDSNRRIAAWRRKHLSQIQTEHCFIVVHRAEYSVCYRRVESEAYLLLQSLQAGKTLGDALDAAFHNSQIPEEKWPALVQEWFGLWMELGWFSA